MIVSILGGGSGTTLDAFLLIHEAQKYGARVALYGRKINNSEHQLAFIQMLRYITDGVIEPREAVRAYHGVLQELKITPQRSLEDDLKLQTNVMSYGGSGTVISLPTPSAEKSETTASPTSEAGRPNFAKMSASERLGYHQERLKRLFGDK